MPESAHICFFGSSLVSSYWNGAATYYRGIARSLHALGHRVTFFEPDALDRQKHRDIDDPPWATVVVYPAESEDDVLRTVARARGADLVVKASGVGVHDALLERAVLDLRSEATPVVFWDVDAPHTLDRLAHAPADPFRALVPRYDLVLTYGGGQRVVDAYRALGARGCIPVYNAVDPSTHHCEPARIEFDADLSFLANRLPDREARVQHFFFEAARRAPEFDYLLGGSGWEGCDLPPNVRSLGHVPTRDHNVFNCSARMVLNVNRESMARFGWSPPTRIFEAAGAGACMIVDAWDGIEDFLEPGREVLVARDADEVNEHLRRIGPSASVEIGERARRRVLRDHTYTQRARQIEDLLLARMRVAA